ncbi:MAG: DEAD/DEAH box helicase [Cytophagales bacterium]|nr:DEAD/DEAH box helicase [Cytophagales bacterium]
MYNSVTEEKIRQVPQIGNIDISRLPMELTRIYSRIISIRRYISNGTIDLIDSDIINDVTWLQNLASNLETILITIPDHENKESIAFVAATAHNLIFRVSRIYNFTETSDLKIDAISRLVSASILFLIGNSQADAAEISSKINVTQDTSPTRSKMVFFIKSLARGELSQIVSTQFIEDEITFDDELEAAQDYLWRELGLGIQSISKKLTKKPSENQEDHFQKVIDISSIDISIPIQIDLFTGPLHLAKLLKILESDILLRGVVNIPPPKGIDSNNWTEFLQKIADERPYLWENHFDAVKTGFIEPGNSAILTLPTGAGKSTLAELKIASTLITEKKIIYLVPTHALEDQVKKNLKSVFKDYESEVFEMDSEYSEILEIESFTINVMTPEKCLTSYNINPKIIEDVGLVVFDEFHLIHGVDIKRDRRSLDAMYCLITLLTYIPHADYLLVSAMVENGNEIADWIKSITGRNCFSFNSSWKPTRQLHGSLIFEQEEINSLRKKINLAKSTATTVNPPSQLQSEMTIGAYCLFSLRNIWETENEDDYIKIKPIDQDVRLAINKGWRLTSNRNDVASRLGSYFAEQNLKTLIFVDNPIIANSTANKVSDLLKERENSFTSYISNNYEVIQSLKEELGDFKYSYLYNRENVGVHHGLLLPIERSLIENYFRAEQGSIVLVATATLAQGINLPAEMVIIAGDDRYNDDTNFRERIPPHELLNAAGRAGRAGLSSQGGVIVIPGEIVTIDGSNISPRWWDLKNEIFSKSDQCLKVEDPLEFFLDSLQDDSHDLTTAEINSLYRFKPENISENETKQMLKNSFYSFKAVQLNQEETFDFQVQKLLDRRNEMDSLSENLIWSKEISFKTGIDPDLILELSNAIDKIQFDDFIQYSVSQYIDFLINWLAEDEFRIKGTFTKQNTISQINRVVGLKPQNEDFEKIKNGLATLKDLLNEYILGANMEKLDSLIPGKSDPFLTKTRNFIIRLIPEVSFAFGLLSMVIIEKAKQNGKVKEDLSMNIRFLASCIREGVESSTKLFFKRNFKMISRVQTHAAYDGA